MGKGGVGAQGIGWMWSERGGVRRNRGGEGGEGLIEIPLKSSDVYELNS